MLIAMCGIDGSGKTTQIELLYNALRDKYSIYLTKQPTDNYRRNDRFRKYINRELEDANSLILNELALLAASDKLWHYESEIKNNVNDIIICDRHVYSGYAYFLSRGLKDISWLKKLNDKLVLPDITFYIDIDPEIALARIINRDGRSRKKEETDIELISRVRNNFLQQPWGKSDHYYILNGDNSPIEIHNEILNVVKKYLSVN